jgi:orotidine-5'-phosphate decarboxylase
MVKGDDLTISMTALHACFEPICEKGLDNGLKLLVNSSRSILYCSKEKDYSKKAMEAASKLQNEMKEYMLEKGLI